MPASVGRGGRRFARQRVRSGAAGSVPHHAQNYTSHDPPASSVLPAYPMETTRQARTTFSCPVCSSSGAPSSIRSPSNRPQQASLEFNVHRTRRPPPRAFITLWSAFPNSLLVGFPSPRLTPCFAGNTYLALPVRRRDPCYRGEHCPTISRLTM